MDSVESRVSGRSRHMLPSANFVLTGSSSAPGSLINNGVWKVGGKSARATTEVLAVHLPKENVKSLLNDYNQIVMTNSGSGADLPPITIQASAKRRLRSHTTSEENKVEHTRSQPIFTEGISSYSRRQEHTVYVREKASVPSQNILPGVKITRNKVNNTVLLKTNSKKLNDLSPGMNTDDYESILSYKMTLTRNRSMLLPKLDIDPEMAAAGDDASISPPFNTMRTTEAPITARSFVHSSLSTARELRTRQSERVTSDNVEDKKRPEDDSFTEKIEKSRTPDNSAHDSVVEVPITETKDTHMNKLNVDEQRSNASSPDSNRYGFLGEKRYREMINPPSPNEIKPSMVQIGELSPLPRVNNINKIPMFQSMTLQTARRSLQTPNKQGRPPPPERKTPVKEKRDKPKIKVDDENNLPLIKEIVPAANKGFVKKITIGAISSAVSGSPKRRDTRLPNASLDDLYKKGVFQEHLLNIKTLINRNNSAGSQCSEDGSSPPNPPPSVCSPTFGPTLAQQYKSATKQRSRQQVRWMAARSNVNQNNNNLFITIRCKKKKKKDSSKENTPSLPVIKTYSRQNRNEVTVDEKDVRLSLPGINMTSEEAEEGTYIPRASTARHGRGRPRRVRVKIPPIFLRSNPELDEEPGLKTSPVEISREKANHSLVGNELPPIYRAVPAEFIDSTCANIERGLGKCNCLHIPIVNVYKEKLPRIFEGNA